MIDGIARKALKRFVSGLFFNAASLGCSIDKEKNIG